MREEDEGFDTPQTAIASDASIPKNFASSQTAIRRKRASDDAALMELFNEETFINMASTRGPFVSLEEFRSWLNGLAKTRFEIVYEHDGLILGYGGLFCFDDRLSHCGWLCLGVRENFQRRGIGATLLRTLIVTADVIAGLQRIQLTVFADNDVALRLYERFGFEIEGRHRRFIRRGSTFADAVSMARIFEDAESAASRSEVLRRIDELRRLWAPPR